MKLVKEILIGAMMIITTLSWLLLSVTIYRAVDNQKEIDRLSYVLQDVDARLKVTVDQFFSLKNDEVNKILKLNCLIKVEEKK